MTSERTEKDIQNAIISILFSLRRSMRYAMEHNNLSLSPLYFIILKLIHDNTSCTPQRLAELSGRDKGQVTRLIKELETQDLIRKIKNPIDKRSCFLELSEQGQRCFQTLQAHDLDALEAMTAGIDHHELELFLSIANKMADNLERFPKQIRD